jgi:RHS repeat-associated protein
MNPTYRCFVLVLALALATGIASAQAQVPTGTPPFSSLSGGPDVINLANLNTHQVFPVLHKAGRSLPFNMDLTHDNTLWQPVSTNGVTTWTPVSTFGWSGSALNVGSEGYSQAYVIAFDGSYGIVEYYNFGYYDGFGTSHPWLSSGSGCKTGAVDIACVQWNYYTAGFSDFPFTDITKDSSGYTLTADACAFETTPGYPTTCVATSSLTSVDGNYILPQNLVPISSAVKAGSVIDRNGNEITVDASGNFTDTLGTIALKTAGGNPNPYTLTYTSPAGTQVAVTVTFKTYPVRTHFNCSNIADYGANGAINTSLVDKITLPDSTFYQFSYEPTPGFPADVTARLATVTLPTGGTITYAYSGGGTGVNGITCADGTPATLQRVLKDGGSWTGTWMYSRTLGTGAASTTTITDPQSNNTVIQFQGNYEAQRQVYQGSATPANLLQTTTTCYNGNTTNCPGTAIPLPITKKAVVTAFPTGLQSEHDDLWNTYGFPSESDDYDFGQGVRGALLRKTLITYFPLGTNIHAFKQSVIVQDGAGHTVSQTSYSGYDETSVVAPTGITPQHVNVGSAIRGNLTTVSQTVGSSTITKKYAYYDTGNVQKQTDVNGAIAIYNYPDAVSTCGNSSPTSISEPLNMSKSMTWNCTGGVQLSAKDENGNSTTTTYSDKYFWRPASTNYPDGGQTSFTYNSATSVTTTTKMSGTQNVVRTVLQDGLGRTKQSQLNSDPFGVDYTDTTYDGLGRIFSVSNPYRSTSDATYGLTKYAYDALGRSTSVTAQDGAVSTIAYSGNTATFTDPAGIAQKTFSDSLGRITMLLENPSGPAYVTNYAYDALGNLTCVVQKAFDPTQFTTCAAAPATWRPRSFAYDSLSRLLSSTNPESGTTTYTYDNSGNVLTKTSPAPNQTGAATVTISKCYDLLNRITAKGYAYSPSPAQTCSGTPPTLPTPAATYTYDLASLDGATFTNPMGHLVRAATLNNPYPAKTYFSYDTLGRILSVSQCVYINCGTFGSNPPWWVVTNNYDQAGDLTSYTDANGVTLTQSFDAARRPSQLASSWVDAQHPATLVTGASYYSSGQTLAINFGNRLLGTWFYNNRLQVCADNLNSQGVESDSCGGAFNPYGNVQSDSYDYTNFKTSPNNGDVLTWFGTGQQGFSRQYTYDTLNRLSTYADNYIPQACKGLSWTYDAWGNRTDQSVTAGTCNTFHQAVNTKNQLVGSSYDSAGNLLAANGHTFSYDAENRMQNVDSGSTVYVYDALGRRVAKSGTYYVYDSESQVVSERNSSNAWVQTYLHLGGKLVATYHSTSTQFVHQDHLGSTRVVSLYSSSAPYYSISDNMDYLPFGEQIAGGSATSHKFTGDERDGETGGLDHTKFRQYSSSFGRWLTSDPGDLKAACVKDPQTQNRYSYVTNNPLNKVDRLGLWGDDGGGGGGCDPFLDPFCGGSPFPGGGGGYGGGPIGGPSETPKTTMELIPPDFFNPERRGDPQYDSVTKWHLECFNQPTPDKRCTCHCIYSDDSSGCQQSCMNCFSSTKPLKPNELCMCVCKSSKLDEQTGKSCKFLCKGVK